MKAIISRQYLPEAAVTSAPQHIGPAVFDILSCDGRLHHLISSKLDAPALLLLLLQVAGI